MRYLVAVGIVVLVLLALSAAWRPADGPGTTSIEPSGQSGLATHSIVTANGERSYLTYNLSDPAPGPRAVVLLFHGHGGSAKDVVADNGRTPSSKWLEIAGREGLVLVIPNGVEGSDRKRGWNDCRADAETNPESDDVAFVERILNEIALEVQIDKGAVFAAGLSNGGHFSLRLAIERPDLVAGVGAVAAAMPMVGECAEPTEPVAVLLMNGTDDPILPFYGGQMAFNRGRVLGSAESIAVWADLAEVEPDAVLTRFADVDGNDGSTVIRADHHGDVPVTLYTIEGGGHTEPSLTERHRRVWTRVVGPQNNDIEMAEQIWSFWQGI